MDVILKTKENFEEFYNNTYNFEVENYYNQLKSKKEKIILTRAIVMIALYAIIFVLSGIFDLKNKLPFDYYPIGMCAICAFIFVSVINSIYKNVKEEMKKNNEYILKDLIAFASENDANKIDYFKDQRVSKEAIEKLDLFNLSNVNYDGKNYIKANYNGNSMVFSDIEIFTYNTIEKNDEIYKNGKKYIRTTKKKVRNHIFKGLYIGANLNKRIENHIYLIPNNIKDTFIQKTINKYIKYKGNQINLENVEFSKKYKVYSDDEVQARYILSLTLMEKINKIDELFDCKKYIILKKGRRFAICLEDFSIDQITNIVLPPFRNKNSEFKKLSEMFEKINNLFRIYHILELDNDLYIK